MLDIEHIFSAVQIGNTLSIKMRQKPGAELNWVTLIHTSTGTRVIVKADLITEESKTGEFSL